ncbi:MAG: hypothetical protein AABX04_01205 [Nanoarchaeota archaeon]
MKVKILFFGMLVLGILFVSGCTEQSIFSFTKVTYDKVILEEFSKTEWVPVLVRLKDNSDIKIEGTKEQRVALSKQRDEWFKPVIDEVLSTLSKKEFELAHKRFDGFSGKITKEGFQKLLNNPAVKEIIWEKGPFPHIS